MELWERFGYYGLQAVLAFFFVTRLNMTDSESFAIFGAFSAMTYGYVAVGGYIGDKILGTQRTIILGAITLTIGYFIMAIAGDEKYLVFLSLGTIACGNGLFKANPSSLLSKIYKDDEKNLDSAFTMYYMSINIGAMISMLLVPMISSMYSHSLGFAVCVFGLLAALSTFIGFRYLIRGVDSEVGLQPVNKKLLLLVIGGTLAVILFSTWLLTNLTVANIIMTVLGVLVYGTFFKLIIQSQGAERRKMIAAIILIVEAIVFFTLYQQMPTSLNFFAIHNVETKILGFDVPDPQMFQTLNAFWIMVASPILAIIYNRLGERGKDFSMPTKFTMGVLLTSLSFLWLGVADDVADESGMVSAWWLVISYFLSSVGELLISGLGLSMISKLVPQKLVGFLMGAWFFTTAIAAILGGKVASLTSLPEDVTNPLMTLPIYTDVFTKIGIASMIVTVLMAIGAPKLQRLIDAKD